mgnify:CR=1 FL=1
MVSFNQIQPNWKLPGTSIEVDPSQAGTATSVKYGLITGYKRSVGTAPAGQLVAVGTQVDADRLFGAGSQLARMFARWFQINKSTPLFALPIAEPSSGTAATGTIVVAAAATAAGTLALYIAGQKVSIAIGASDATTAIATRINAAINAATDLPVTSSVASSTVTVTAKWKGIDGNDIRLEDSYLGAYGGEVLPTGLSLTYPAGNVLSGGSGVPDWASPITAIGDDPFYYIAMPFSDSGSFTAFDTEFGFSDSGRWGWLRQSYGQVFSATRDTYSNLMTWGPTNNSAVIHALGIEMTSPTPVWEWTAAFSAQAARALSIDPARPLQTLTLDGCLPAPKGSRFSKTQLNALATVGIAIQGTDIYGPSGGTPIILREQSTYQKNSYGIADNAYEVGTTLATLAEVFTRLRQSISNKYPRHKLANDGTRFGPGQAIVTPNIARAELVAEYGAMEYDGLVENVDAFKGALIVARSATEPNTLECLYPPDLINQLRRFNVRAQFRLQFAS